MRIFAYFFSLLIFASMVTEFSYYLPIGLCNDLRFLCYHISQSEIRLIALNDLSLILENGQNQQAFNSILPFVFSPAQPVLFFNKTGFSFFDQGVLKSKYFCFRSPGSIYTSIPFDHTMGLHWYDPQNGVVSILKKNTYVLYNVSLKDGSMIPLIDASLHKSHAIFPFIFKDILFYVLDSQLQSEIVISDKAGKTKSLFKVQNSKIISFSFFNETSGAFGLHSLNTDDNSCISFDFYFFDYYYETKLFDAEFAFNIKIPVKILNLFFERNLFPWCIQPVKLMGKMYILENDGDQFKLREFDRGKGLARKVLIKS